MSRKPPSKPDKPQPAATLAPDVHTAKAKAKGLATARALNKTRRDGFVDQFLATGDGLVAMAAAGYKNPGDKAVDKLLADPKVRIALHKVYASERMTIDKKMVLERIRRCMDLTGQATVLNGQVQLLNVGAHLRCVDMLAKHTGVYRTEAEDDLLKQLTRTLSGAPDPT